MYYIYKPKSRHDVHSKNLDELKNYTTGVYESDFVYQYLKAHGFTSKNFRFYPADVDNMKITMKKIIFCWSKI